ncbi:MAG: hypothetical protein WC876_06475 [Candidatus Thermoplasmatota archaeon]|jgi:hypothetical protein
MTERWAVDQPEGPDKTARRVSPEQSAQPMEFGQPQAGSTLQQRISRLV